MIITAHQPNYMPWLGFFQRMDFVDKFIILDNVQFTKKFFIHRNKIRTDKGSLMLTVPVIVSLDTLIKDVIIDNSQKWRKSHWLSIQYNYCKAPYWKYLCDELEVFYSKDWAKLFDLNIGIIKLLMSKLGINTEIIIASSLDRNFGKKNDLLINLCSFFNADRFYPGNGCKTYIDEDMFINNDIKLTFQQFNHPIYPQLPPKSNGDFISHLSVLDLLFNCGPDSLDIIRSSSSDYDSIKKICLAHELKP